MKNIVTKKMEINNYLASYKMWGLWNNNSKKWLSSKGKRLMFNNRSEALHLRDKLTNLGGN